MYRYPQPRIYPITDDQLTVRANDFLQTLQKVSPEAERIRIEIIRDIGLSKTDEPLEHQECYVGAPHIKVHHASICAPDQPILDPKQLDRRAEGFLNTLKVLDPSICGIRVALFRYEPENEEFIDSYSKQVASVGRISQSNAQKPTLRVTHAEHKAKVEEEQRRKEEQQRSSYYQPTDSYVDMTAAMSAITITTSF